jgi:hypothetical protein
VAQKLEQGSIVFIDVPTQLPDLSPSKGTLLPCSTSYEEYRRYSIYAELHILSLYLTSLLCSSGLVIPNGCFTLCAALVFFCKGEVRTIQSSLTHLYQSQFQNDVFLAIRYHIAAPDDLDHTVRILLQLSTYHIEVLPLPTGRVVRSVVRCAPSLIDVCPASFL